MEIQDAKELFLQHDFITDEFDRTSDEFLCYDMEQDIIYAFSMDCNHQWKRVFSMNDCIRRWIEFIHPIDGCKLERELVKLQEGQSSLNMRCRFGNEERYSWYLIVLKEIELQKGAETHERMAIGYRRSASLSSQHNDKALHDKIDPQLMVYTMKAWEDAVQENLWRYPKQRGFLCVIDFNNFKEINEQFGCHFGDEVLSELVRLLRSLLDSSAMIGRLGADTFGIYVSNVTGEEQWVYQISCVIVHMKQLYEKSVKKNYISISAGGAYYPKDGKRASELYEHAKEAWVYSKISKPDRLEIYQEGKMRSTWKVDMAQMNNRENIRESVATLLDESPVWAMTKDLFADVSVYPNSLNLLLKRLCERYEVSAARIYEYLPENRCLLCTYEWIKGNFKKLWMERVNISSDNVSSKMSAMKRLGAVQQVDEFSSENFHALKSRVIDGQTVELAFQGKYLGRLHLLDYTRTHEWTNQDKAELSWVGDILSLLLSCGVREITDEEEVDTKELDLLTGLYTIGAFKEKMMQILQNKKPKKKYLLVYSDISNFKYVNETFNYDVGDSILGAWADILKKETPDVVLACRDSVDHFVSLREVSSDMSEDEIVERVNMTKGMVESRIRNRFRGSNFSLNTGAYCIERGDEDLSAAIARANMARKKARHFSTGCELYTDQMRREADEATAMVAGLDEALERKEFQIYLQPKVACVSQEIVGAEALVRWIRNGEQIVYPDRFIGIFEQYGCIVKVDYCVYEQVFALVQSWIKEKKALVPISVNVSRAHFRTKELIKKIEQLIEKYPIPTDTIEFEITESLYCGEMPNVDEVLDYLRKRGFKVSMDDFGAEGSSLNALSTIPVDVIKMDRVFMKKKQLERKDKVIISNVIKMANELEKEIICEGVETEAQRNFITDAGCDSWQGYLKSKPVPVGEFEAMIEHLKK